MEPELSLLSLVLHPDQHFAWLVTETGMLIYVLLFAIVFVETGLVFMPFLPGDSLLFVTGAFCGTGVLSLPLILFSLFIAAVLGDMVNYHVGRYFGTRVFDLPMGKRINPQHLERTQRFFEKYGTKAIVIARFVPIVRTFAPFMAGVGQMSYPRFAVFNILGAFLWVVGITLVGYWFGNLPLVKQYFSLVILGIIALSLLPILFEVLAEHHRRKQSLPAAPSLQ